jgi:hypothetical protein
MLRAWDYGPEKITHLFMTQNIRPVYTTSVLGTAPLKMGTHAQNFRHGTSAFWRVNVTKIGTGAAKFKRAETFSRGSLGTSSKRCRAQISKKIKNVFDIKHAQNKLSSFQYGSKRRKTTTCQKLKKNKVNLTQNVNVALVDSEILMRAVTRSYSSK